MFFSCVRCAKQKWVVYFTNLLKYVYTSPGFAGCSCTYRNNAGSLHVECHQTYAYTYTYTMWVDSKCYVCLFVIVYSLYCHSRKLFAQIKTHRHFAMRVHQLSIPSGTWYLGSCGLNRRDSNAAPNELGLLRLGFEPTVSCMRCQRFITTSLRNIR